jgi:non-specific serine/threonine protein kinase/serine/threonine-protein kinase
MKRERLKRVEQIYHAALEQEGAARATFVDRECEGDEELRSEVESLIACEDRAQTFIESPALEVAAALLARDHQRSSAGRRIGAYEVVGLIGEGGMGSVLRAVRADDQYKRQVAIKLVKPGSGTNSIVNRFLAERQILASLDHPNIARLFDGGVTEEGLPYFVMEYIEGLPIVEYSDGHKLTTVERLKLFRSVCSAVNYAHQNLVVHRDIKPTNILVTSDGAAKLLDFGIAKLLDGDTSSQTSNPPATTQHFMTPGYASPEQVRGDPITTSSDQYSLGVLLYELLTGHRPYNFKSSAPQEIARVICEQEPERPSTAIRRVEEITDSTGVTVITVTPDSVSKTREGQIDKLRRRLAGDIDTIVLKAMRKEPHRRYGSVEQFSEDIRRHLEGLPVIARNDTVSYRTGKFIKRHKAVVIAATVVVITLVGGIIATSRQARVAERERARSERRFAEVRQLANSSMFEFHDEIANLTGATRAREHLVKKAVAYLDSLAHDSAGDSALQLELAIAYRKVGDIQGSPYHTGTPANLGDTSGALESYQKSRAILEQLVSADPANRAASRELANDLLRVGPIMGRSGDTTGALENQRRGLAILERIVADEPAETDLSVQLADNYQTLEFMLMQARDISGAFESARRAVSIFERLVAADPNNPATHMKLGISFVEIGNLLELSNDAAGRMENDHKALESYRRAQALLERSMASQSENPQLRLDMGTCYSSIGWTLARIGDKAGAMEHYRKALAIDDSLLAADLADSNFRHLLASGYSEIAHDQVAAGDVIGGLESLRKAQAIREATSDADPTNARNRRDLALAYFEYAALLTKTGRAGDALDYYRRVATIREAMSATDPNNIRDRRDLAVSYSKLGDVYVMLASKPKTGADRQFGAWREARSWYQKSLDILVDIRDRGLLPGSGIQLGAMMGPSSVKVENISSDISKCDAALAKLQSSRASGN